MRNRPRGGTAPVPVPYRPVLFSPSCKALALFSRPVLIVSKLWCARDSRHIRRGQFCTPRGKLGNCLPLHAAHLLRTIYFSSTRAPGIVAGRRPHHPVGLIVVYILRRKSWLVLYVCPRDCSFFFSSSFLCFGQQVAHGSLRTKLVAGFTR